MHATSNFKILTDVFPSLETERLSLLPIRHAHAGDLFKLFGDPRVTQYYNIITLTREDEAQKYIDWFQSRFTEKTGIRWGIALKGHDNIIGTVGFNSFTQQHRANIGYDLQASFWHKGYMTEALRSIIIYGFQELGINRIEAEVMQGNSASERVLRKLGFKNEGVLRDWMYWNSEYYDMTMFSLLASDFR